MFITGISNLKFGGRPAITRRNADVGDSSSERNIGKTRCVHVISQRYITTFIQRYKVTSTQRKNITTIQRNILLCCRDVL